MLNVFKKTMVIPEDVPVAMYDVLYFIMVPLIVAVEKLIRLMMQRQPFLAFLKIIRKTHATESFLENLRTCSMKLYQKKLSRHLHVQR